MQQAENNTRKYRFIQNYSLINRNIWLMNGGEKLYYAFKVAFLCNQIRISNSSATLMTTREDKAWRTYKPSLQLCTCRPPTCQTHTSQRCLRWRSCTPSAAPPKDKDTRTWLSNSTHLLHVGLINWPYLLYAVETIVSMIGMKCYDCNSGCLM